MMANHDDAVYPLYLEHKIEEKVIAMKPREGEFSYYIQSELDEYLDKKESLDGAKKKKSKPKLSDKSGNESKGIENLLNLDKSDRNNSYSLYQCFSHHLPESKDPEYKVYRAVLFVISNKPDVESRVYNETETAKLDALGAALREFTNQKLDRALFPYIIKHAQPGILVDAFTLLKANELLSHNNNVERVVNHPDPLNAARAINSLRNINLTNDIYARILQNESPFHAALAYKELDGAKIHHRLIDGYLAEALRAPYPNTAAQGIILLHKKGCDSQKNRDALISSCSVIGNVGAIIAVLKNKDEIEAVLHHPQKDNLMKIFSLLEQSKLLKPVNIEILLDKRSATMLDNDFFKSVWKDLKAPVTQDKFNQILAHMKKEDALKKPNSVAGELTLGFIRPNNTAQNNADMNNSNEYSEPRHTKK